MHLFSSAQMAFGMLKMAPPMRRGLEGKHRGLTQQGRISCGSIGYGADHSSLQAMFVAVGFSLIGSFLSFCFGRS